MLGAITLSLQLQRTTYDLLDALSIEVAAHNTGKAPVSVRFPAPPEYRIDVLRNGNVIWSSMTDTAPATAIPPHAKMLMPGPTVLAVYVWNETAKDGASIVPGDYTIRARLLGETASPQAAMHVRFAAPTAVSALAALHAGDQVTIAGRLDSTRASLTDSSGTIALAKRLLGAPDVPVAIRGYVTMLPDKTRAFYVERWAPLGE